MERDQTAGRARAPLAFSGDKLLKIGPAIHQKALSGNEGAVFARQIKEGPRKVGGLKGALEASAPVDPLDLLGRRFEGIVLHGDDSRREGVDGDPVISNLRGPGLG